MENSEDREIKIETSDEVRLIGFSANTKRNFIILSARIALNYQILPKY